MSLPTDHRYLDVARLVVGGVVSRLPLSYEDLDDVQLAVESVLRSGLVRTAQVTANVAVVDDRLVITVGPLDDASLRRCLQERGNDTLGLGTLLSRLADHVEPVFGPAGACLVLTKKLQASAPARS